MQGFLNNNKTIVYSFSKQIKSFFEFIYKKTLPGDH